MSAQIKIDNLARLVKSISELTGNQVLVGIPEADTDRTGDQKQEATNALLGYVHEFGSPANNIPARPFLIPGINDAKDKIEEHLKRAAKAACNYDNAGITREMNATGIDATSSVKNKITNGQFAPLKPATIAARARSRGTKSRRDSESEYMKLIKQGVSPADAQSASGIKPLINTGQLRDAITYVVRKAK